MKLVKRTAAAAAQAPGATPETGRAPQAPTEHRQGEVAVDPRIVQTFGIRAAPVVRGVLAGGVEAVGSVQVDEGRIRAVEARAPGWIEQLEVRAAGDAVTRGQRLAGLYSPELFAAQSELVLAARAGDATLVEATRQRLTLLGVSASQVEQVLASGRAQRQVAVLAPADGIVTELNVRAGQQVASSEPLMRIADLASVWITIAAPEAHSASVRRGARAQARLRAVPQRVFEGRVDYVYPRLDAATRTVSARIALDNPQGLLKPGMYAEVTLIDEFAPSALLVPLEAVIRTGTRSVVIVAEGQGRFRPVEVGIGAERGDTIEIVSGLTGDEHVVVSGQFLIDSEASLRGAFNRMAPTPHGEHR
jgi:Cu(I)/Ag(I) efflux system membrane fusion protein